MPNRKRLSTATPPSLAKSPTGIEGLDEITGGGLPSGRPTLVCGAAGCGKTMLAMEFLICGATRYNEPGVFMMFEETEAEITMNVRSLGFDLQQLVRQKKLRLDHVQIERSEIEETGEYDLDGLFIRLGHAIDSIGAKRVVLDTLEALFSGLPNHAILRAELRRLFRWLKDRGVTAVITGERGDNALTRYGLEEYVADCVIVLDHRIREQLSTRRLRIIKYRGTSHGTNEYPFLIGERGISVLPITSLQLAHRASSERMPTGIAKLDEMLGGRGLFRGSSVLVSGSPGTGKSSVGATFAVSACRRGERALIFAYEESPDQLIRNMRSIGVELEPWIKKCVLQIHASRPTMRGVEQNLLLMHDIIRTFRPGAVVVDPISNLTLESNEMDAKPMLMRLIDLLKQQQITALFISLTSDGSDATPETSQVGVSSLMDTWLLLRNVEFNGERNRTLFVMKSRGMAHSNQVREFILGKKGIDLVDVYLGADRVLTGTARVVQGEQERVTRELREQEREQNQRRLHARIASLQAELDEMQLEAKLAEAREKRTLTMTQSITGAMSRSRHGAPDKARVARAKR